MFSWSIKALSFLVHVCGGVTRKSVREGAVTEVWEGVFMNDASL